MIDPDLKYMLVRIYSYIYEFTQANTYLDIGNARIGGAEADLRFMHEATRIILNAVILMYASPGALPMLDNLWVDIHSDLALLCDNCPYPNDPNDVEHIRAYGVEYLERYQSRVNFIMSSI